MKQRNNDCSANCLIINVFGAKLIFINYIFEYFFFLIEQIIDYQSCIDSR